MPEECVSFIEKYQTLVVGFIGFAGVIVTILLNARSVRKDRDLQRNHDRNALRTALYAELGIIRNQYVELSLMKENNEDNAAFIPDRVPNQVYTQLIERIGLLSTEEITPIMNAYLRAADLPVRLRLLSSLSGESRQQPGYIAVGKDYVKNASEMYESFIEPIDTAMKILEKNLGATEKRVCRETVT